MQSLLLSAGYALYGRPHTPQEIVSPLAVDRA